MFKKELMLSESERHLNSRPRGSIMRSSAKKILVAASLGLATMAASPASAAFDVCAGSGQQCAPQTDTNVLLTGGTNLTQVRANFNGSNVQTGVFTSVADNGNLTADASGQAMINATTGLLNDLTFMTINGITFKTATFNIVGSGIVDIFGLNATGQVTTEQFTLGNGSNFFGVTATGTDVLTGIRFTSATGVQDFRQLRLGGVSTLTTAVPEPGTWAMMLVGFGAMGVAMRRRRRDAMLTQMA
jgi:hypothetical protein